MSPVSHQLLSMTQNILRPFAAQNDPVTSSQAVSSWENGGGAHALPLPLAEDDERMLRRLGVAVILLWNSLPSHIQRRLFARALTVDVENQEIPLKERIARFLHEHKDDASATSGPTV
jgi:hypothetical protein